MIVLFKECGNLSKKDSIHQFTNVLWKYSDRKSHHSEPNDGSFISYSPLDSFSQEGVVRYGEETDVDDI